MAQAADAINMNDYLPLYPDEKLAEMTYYSNAKDDEMEEVNEPDLPLLHVHNVYQDGGDDVMNEYGNANDEPNHNSTAPETVEADEAYDAGGGNDASGDDDSYIPPSDGNYDSNSDEKDDDDRDDVSQSKRQKKSRGTLPQNEYFHVHVAKETMAKL